jgi:DNA polymerase-3 subunit chi
VIAISEENVNSADVLFLVDGTVLPTPPVPYERVVVLFDGADEEATAMARAAWTECRSRGLTVTYWQTDEGGRWQRRG